MIVRLRKRLTLAAIAALILIFAVTVAAINLANAWSLRSQILQSLQMLMGSYIPPSEREKVFDRFYRAESAAQTQGSGIGLAIARSIAVLHHGDIFLESNEASGTAFIVTLPEDAKKEIKKYYGFQFPFKVSPLQCEMSQGTRGKQKPRQALILRRKTS